MKNQFVLSVTARVLSCEPVTLQNGTVLYKNSCVINDENPDKLYSHCWTAKENAVGDILSIAITTDEKKGYKLRFFRG